MIEAVFTDEINSVTVPGLTQWDYGQELRIKGLTLPSEFQVHFACKRLDKALVRNGTFSDGVGSVMIPDKMLQQDTDLTAWVYVANDKEGETLNAIYLPIKTRTRPSDYISPPDDQHEELIDLAEEIIKIMERFEHTEELIKEVVESVQAEGTTQIGKVQSEGTKQVSTIANEGKTQIANVKNEGSKQIENVQNEAEKIIAEREQIEKNKTDIATLNEEMELLAPAIICTASGESIKVDDSAERRAQGFGLHGKTEQTKTLGRNLMNNVTNDTNKNFVDAVIKDDEYVITVKTDNASSAHRIFVIPKATKDFNGKSIVISNYDAISENGGTPKTLLFVVNVNNGVASHFRTITDLKPSQKYTFGKDIVYDNPNLFVALALYANNTDNSKARQKVTYKNLYAYFENEPLTEWEPFTGLKPSPSPDYPQEIQSIGEEKEGKYSVDVKTIGKNLVATDGDFVTANCIAIDKSTVKSNIVNSMYSNIIINDKKYLDFIFKNMGNRINFKCDLSNGTNKTIEIIIYGKRTNGSSYFITTGNNLKASAIIPKDFISLSAVEFRFNRHLENITDKTSVYTNLMAWIGDDDAPFQPYKESLSNIQLDQPLYEGDKIYLEDGELWEYRENGRVVFDGSEDEAWAGYSSTDTEYIFCIKDINLHAPNVKQYCNRFRFRYAVSHPYNGLFAAGTNSIYFGISKTLTSDPQQWKSWLQSNPIEVVYKVTTPTIKKLGKIEDFGELKTYYPITHITNNEDAEMEVEYVADTKNYVDNKVAANVANIISQYQTNISNLLSLMPMETQATMIENDTNNILESEVTQ